MNIGIIGYGIVGKSIELQFKGKAALYINDIKNKNSDTKREIVEKCDFIFVCVPTPFNMKEKKIETGNITEVVYTLNECSKSLAKKPIVVIKSAITPQSIKDWEIAYSSLSLVVSPEYLTERTYEKDAIDIKCLILGGDLESCNKVSNLYTRYSNCDKEYEVGIVPKIQQAALLKYMENTFMAMVNIFHNQYYSLYHTLGITKGDEDYNKLLEVFYLDKRMGVLPFKYTVPGPDGDFGYGGKCLPKDIKAILSESETVGTSLSLLKHVDEVNENIRTNRDWEKIEGAML